VTDDDKEPPGPPPAIPPHQQATLRESFWEQSRRSINLNLYGLQQSPLPLQGATAADTRYEELQARVALLESAVYQVRHQSISSAQDREVGVGHNQGPALALVSAEELDEIDKLVALLKDRGPVPPADPTPLIEQSAKADALGKKIIDGVVAIGKEMAKGAAREVGRELFAWLAVSTLISMVVQTLRTWLGL
jgi:hypothetical protein